MNCEADTPKGGFGHYLHENTARATPLSCGFVSLFIRFAHLYRPDCSENGAATPPSAGEFSRTAGPLPRDPVRANA